MKCPYMCKTTAVDQTDHEYDGEGRIISTTNRYLGGYVLMDCLENECGAYYDGRCHYKG